MASWPDLRLLTDRSEPPAALPYPRHSFPQLLVRDVEIPLRLLDIRVTEHQLNRADVHVLRQEATRAFVTEVVPVQIPGCDWPPSSAANHLQRLFATQTHSLILSRLVSGGTRCPSLAASARVQ